MDYAFGIVTADTKGWKRKFTLSYLIKVFTWYIIKPEVREYFGLNSIEDCPNHSIVFGERTKTNEVLIFEANKTMELNYFKVAYPNDGVKKFSYVVNHIAGRDMNAFKLLVQDKSGKLYPLWEFINFIRRALWWWIFRRDIKGAHQYFAWLDVCSELVARDMDNHNLPKAKEELRKINFNVLAPADLLNIAYIGILAGEIIED